MTIQLPVFRDLDQANHLLDQALLELQLSKTQHAFEIGKNAGIALERLKITKSQLEIGNKTLEESITLLRLVHRSELNVCQERISAKIQMVAEQLRGINEKMESYQRKFAQKYLISIEVQLFKDAQQIVDNFKRGGLTTYSEYTPSLVSKALSLSVPTSKELSLKIDDHEIRALVVQTYKECEVLEEQIAGLNEIYGRLCDQKSRMIDFQLKHLKDMRDHERQSLLQNLLEPLRLIFNRIDWGKIATANPAYFTRSGFSNAHAQQYLGTLQQQIDAKINRIKDRTVEIISTLETFVCTHHEEII